VSTPALVVFDLAGTTVEDSGQVAAAFAAALAADGIHVSAEQISRVRGSSKHEALRQFLPGHDAHHLEVLYARFRADLARRYSSDGVRAVPGAETMFASLRRQGVRVALNTGFDREITTLLIEALGWTDAVVDAVVCIDEVAAGRPAPYLIFKAMEATGTYSVRSVANVGDTVLDLQAGFNAATGWNIGVLSGAHARSLLEEAPHTHLIPSVASVEAVWTAPPNAAV
jgi:phosphonatase-like hydrolase